MKKIIIGAGGLCLLALLLHVYLALKPVRITPNLREMARIDIQQPMTTQDAVVITAWLYREKGVDHVMVNPRSRKVIFTYFPYQTSAQQVTKDFTTALPYKAGQFMPTKDQMGYGGCPALR